VPMNSAMAVLARMRLGCSSSGSGRRRTTPMREDGSMMDVERRREQGKRLVKLSSYSTRGSVQVVLPQL
jgi:hypothetical protein